MKTLFLLLFFASTAFAFDPVQTPVNIYSGDDYQQTVELAATPTGAAFDLTGYTCQGFIKKTYYDKSVLQDLNCSIINNRLSFGMTKSATSNLRGLNGVWDLILIDPSGSNTTIWHSLFKIALTTR